MNSKYATLEQAQQMQLGVSGQRVGQFERLSNDEAYCWVEVWENGESWDYVRESDLSELGLK